MKEKIENTSFSKITSNFSKITISYIIIVIVDTSLSTVGRLHPLDVQYSRREIDVKTIVKYTHVSSRLPLSYNDCEHAIREKW